MLEISQLNVAYGESHVIHDVSFKVGPRESVAIMGRNGMGKTTLLKSLIGLLPVRSAAIRLDGAEMVGQPSYRRVQHGMAFVPQGRMVFPFLSVEQNILCGAEHSGYRQVPDYIYQFFPVLKDMKQRKAGNLSGGQQQMLAISRALMANPELILLDEPSLGLSPKLTKEIFEIVVRINRERGTTILLVEQNANMALNASDYGYVLENGRIVMEDSCERLREKDDIKEFYLGMKDVGVRGERRWKKKKTWR